MAGIALMLVVPVLAAGCSFSGKGQVAPAPTPGKSSPPAQTGESAAGSTDREKLAGAPGQAPPPIGPTPKDRTARVFLYFGDSQAQHVIPEEREVVLGEGSVEEAVVRELLKGPEDPNLYGILPRGTRVLSVKNVAGTVFVNFSRELQTNHPGGSAGEMMTMLSLVYSLTDLPQVKQVQILVEGKKEEVLSAHLTIINPLERGPILTYPVFVDRKRAEWLQARVDRGQETWRLDPLQVAQREGRMAGFTAEDRFTLVFRQEKGGGSGTGEATVEAVHGGKRYRIQLIQPLGPGEKNIWMVNSVTGP